MQPTGEQLFMSENLARELDADDPFNAVMRIEGDPVRSGRGRRTVRFALNGHAYFAKIHTGVGWREIWKNLLSMRLPIVSAANEWRASRTLGELGVRVPKVIAYGARGTNPARLRSFIITEAIEATLTLEQASRHWKAEPLSPNLRKAIVCEVARIARTLHENGVNHRDFYLCHFRIDESVVRNADEGLFDGLWLMDLHRAQIRSRVPLRWRVKDLAGLLFSAMDAPILPRDLWRFIAVYRGVSLRRSVREDARLWRRVSRAALRLYRREHQREPVGTIAAMVKEVA